MKRRAATLAALAAAAGAAGLGTAAWRLRLFDRDGGAEGAAAFWATRFDGLDGKPLEVAGWRGRPLLLNFWATWCAPCITEMPLLDALWQARAEHGWQVLALAVDGAEAVRAFTLKQRLTLPIALAGDSGLALASALGNRAGVLPFTVCFDRSGEVAKRRVGAVEAELLTRWKAELR